VSLGIVTRKMNAPSKEFLHRERRRATLCVRDRFLVRAIARSALSLRELCHVTKRHRNAVILLSRIIARNDKRVSRGTRGKEKERKMAVSREIVSDKVSYVLANPGLLTFP